MIRCNECGRFVKWNNHITYTPYGITGVLEPPEPVYLHPECYKKLDKELLNRSSWIKPHQVKQKKKEADQGASTIRQVVHGTL